MAQEKQLAKTVQKPERGDRVEDRGLAVIVERSAELAAVAVGSEAKASIEAALIIAKKFPRDEDRAEARLIAACENAEFAAKARYKKPIAGTFIEGPSIRFAEEAIRLWGNIKVQQVAIYEDEQRRVVKVIVYDLEANTSYEREIVIEKLVERRNPKDREVVHERVNSSGIKVFIVRATEDELSIKEAAMASKIIRNNGLRMIPQHVMEKAMRRVIETLKGEVKKAPAAAKKSIEEIFAELNVTAKQLADYLGCNIAKATPEQIADLRAVYMAIKDGQATWDQFAQKKIAKAEKPAPNKNSGSLDNLV